MQASKADIITGLQKEMLSLQGLNMSLSDAELDRKVGLIKNAFPKKTFPLGVIHEFTSDRNEDTAVTAGFISTIVSSLMKKNGVTIWIGSANNVFLPALKSFGIAPEKIIFIHLKKEKEMLWAMEEALKCAGIAAVVLQLQELSFTASRRLQLAVNDSGVTGFVIRQNPRNLNTTACVTRWKITALPSDVSDGMPGVGFPRWNVELQKVRNGKPGSWEVEFVCGRLRHNNKLAQIPQQQKQTG